MSELTCGDWQRVRYRAVEDVVAEIEEVLARYTGVKIVGFHDDIFGLDKRMVEGVRGGLREARGLPFWCNERVGTFDEDDVASSRRQGASASTWVSSRRTTR